MLTRTQIENATTEELEGLRAHIGTELERRREEQRQAEEERVALERIGALERHDTPQGTYQWEMVECGHKDRCQKCKSGQKHGPYLYHYFYRGGKQHSEYIPLSRANELAAAGVVPSREEALP